jgi:tetratricopeptide (TPR) repeat protein
MKLNLGIAYHELGEFDKAKTFLGESFLAYRAVEKIGFTDTRYYMAKVSIEQGHVLNDLEEPLDAIVDAYNRAMRLLVEVIEDQQRTDYEQDLANALLDRCVAVYEDWLGREFASNDERNKTIDDVLLDVSRGVELLQKQFNEGNGLARFDLFHALVFQGKVLCDTEKYKEAKVVLDRVTEEFADLGEGDEMFVMQMAMAYICRTVVQMGLGNQELSRQDCQKGMELIGKHMQSVEGQDEEFEELQEQFRMLLEQLK